MARSLTDTPEAETKGRRQASSGACRIRHLNSVMDQDL